MFCFSFSFSIADQTREFVSLFFYYFMRFILSERQEREDESISLKSDKYFLHDSHSENEGSKIYKAAQGKQFSNPPPLC